MSLISVIGGIFDPIKDIISEVVVDKDKRDQVNLQLAELEDQALARLDQLQQGQIEVNKIEASSGSVFVAGWRPFVGWVGGVGLGYSILVQPFLSWIARVAFSYKGDFPVIDNQLMLYVLGGMLGIGGLRTIEKSMGVSTNDMTDVPGRTQPSTTNAEVSIPGTSMTGNPVKKHKKIFGIL